MNKLLDYLNKRDIEVNTIEGARKALHIILADKPQRITHVEGVVRRTQELCEQQNISQSLTDVCIMSAYLHDIGYSDSFKFADFHAVDGFTYLQANSWIKPVQMTALYHSHSDLLANMSRPDVSSVYINNKPSEEDKIVIDLVTNADLTTSPDGCKVTINERVIDIESRYGYDNVVSKHIREVYNTFYKPLKGGIL